MIKRQLKRIICTIIILLLMTGQASAGKSGSTPPHYLPENERRYEDYSSKNPKLAYNTVVAYVNAGVDEVSYSEVEPTANPGSTLVFCTKNYVLPSDFVPDGLVTIGGSQRLRADAAAAFLQMKDDAKKDGLSFVVYSSYRSYNSQKSIYSSYERSSGSTPVDSYSARPGHSEHQTGLALDILQKSGSSSLRSARFQDTAEYSWLTENAYKYGFILRYPSGFEHVTGYTFEPWHWRYVGFEAASAMRNGKFRTYEAYFGTYLAPALFGDASPQLAPPVNYTVTMGDAEFTTEAHIISGESFFRLRDVAYILSGSDARFEIGWDGKADAVSLTSGEEYTASGVELTQIGQAPAVPSDTEIHMDGNRLELTVYNIDGSSYINLREFSLKLGITVVLDKSGEKLIISQ